MRRDEHKGAELLQYPPDILDGGRDQGRMHVVLRLIEQEKASLVDGGQDPHDRMDEKLMTCGYAEEFFGGILQNPGHIPGQERMERIQFLPYAAQQFRPRGILPDRFLKLRDLPGQRGDRFQAAMERPVRIRTAVRW